MKSDQFKQSKQPIFNMIKVSQEFKFVIYHIDDVDVG